MTASLPGATSLMGGEMGGVVVKAPLQSPPKTWRYRSEHNWVYAFMYLKHGR